MTLSHGEMDVVEPLIEESNRNEFTLTFRRRNKHAYVYMNSNEYLRRNLI